LSVVSIVLVVELLELDDAESRFCQSLGVLFGSLPDGAGEAIGGGTDGGAESQVEGKDGLSRRR